MNTKALILNTGNEKLLAELEQWNDGRNAVWKGVIRIVGTGGQTYQRRRTGDDFVPVQLGMEDGKLGEWFIQDAAYGTIETLGQEAADYVVSEALASMDNGVYAGSVNIGPDAPEAFINGVRWQLEPTPRGNPWHNQ